MVADLRNGQEFDGIIHAYFAKRAVRFEVIQNGRTTAYAGRLGDVPAIQLQPDAAGLLTLLYQSKPQTLTYENWEKFAAFASHKDFPDIRERHIARGLPEQDFTETYTRYVKSLIAVGHGRGSDRSSGMRTEFVALANPYTGDLRTGLPVQLFEQGKPRPDAQVEVFERAPDGAVSIRLTRTDGAGTAIIDVKPGHSYLIDAVVLYPAPDGGTAVWDSHWAALTFAVP